MNPDRREPESLFKWIWHSYLKTALIPLILVELVFIGIYFFTDNWSQNEMVSFLREEVQTELQQIANQESATINHQVISITNTTDMYARQTLNAFKMPISLSSTDLSQLTYSSQGSYYTKADTQEGGAAVYYSGVVPVGETERNKVARVLPLQTLMKNIVQSHPLVASIYFNSFDSLNIIYPYFDVISQYPHLMDIHKYNFYYEADAAHNPEHRAKWTEIYLDPAGHGWMASCIAPVYNKDFLEGVVGIDVTVNTIISQILNENIPWQGYYILLGKDGSILALPEKGEQDWGVRELTSHHYNEAILKDTFKPEQFNLYKRPDLSSLARQVSVNSTGFYDFTLNNQLQVTAWATIPETGWKLMVIVPEANIYSRVNQMSKKLFIIGAFMIAGLVVFYCIFFFILSRRAKKMSLNISQPLLEINNMVRKIGTGDYYQEQPDLHVKELQETATFLVNMGRQLGQSNEDLLITQEALQKRESDLQALVNSVDDAVYEMDEHGNFIKLWVQDHTLFTRSIDAIGDASIESFMGTEIANLHISAIKRVIETGISETIEYVQVTPQGERWIQARIALITHDSKIVSVSVRDISERKEMEKSIVAARDEAEQASIAKSEFLSTMSHELRTPLNAVLGFAQLLEIDPAAPLNESQKENVDKIIKGGNHLLVLINEVLDLAKIESGKLTLSIEPVQVKPVMEETLELVQPLADKFKVDIITHFHIQCNAQSDRIRLKQVLLNILSNAIKYNREHGKVYFSCEKHNNNVVISIVDEGYGIPPAELETIFEPFHRLPDHDKTVEGTGVGLTVAKHLVELMHGNILVESQEGVGSHFRVVLPYSPITNTTGYMSGIVSDNSDQFIRPELYKILYVEDNPANLSLIESIIKLYPAAKMLSTARGELSIDLAVAHRPDVILMDINLPGIDGYETLRRLRKYEETRNIPVIAISASAMEKDIQKGLQAGFAEYITKPINVSEFLKIMSKYLHM